MTQNQSEMKMMQEFKYSMRSLSTFKSGRNLCLAYIILTLSKDFIAWETMLDYVIRLLSQQGQIREIKSWGLLP